ncbi:hypothetical protein DIPPA_70037 [Diplonema papillatum]|nr:hypothetical protein DIPPA_70037 [Diplonema papillatum]
MSGASPLLSLFAFHLREDEDKQAVEVIRGAKACLLFRVLRQTGFASDGRRSSDRFLVRDSRRKEARSCSSSGPGRHRL